MSVRDSEKMDSGNGGGGGGAAALGQLVRRVGFFDRQTEFSFNTTGPEATFQLSGGREGGTNRSCRINLEMEVIATGKRETTLPLPKRKLNRKMNFFCEEFVFCRVRMAQIPPLPFLFPSWASNSIKVKGEKWSFEIGPKREEGRLEGGTEGCNALQVFLV